LRATTDKPQEETMLIPQDTLVLVGDGRKALFLRNKGGAGHPDLFAEHIMEQDNPATREQGTDRPGRYEGPAGAPRSAVEQTDWHQQAEDRFAVRVAQVLYKKAHEHEFERLIVVAAPRTLGTLRSAFRKEVAQKVTAEIPKDLTSRQPADIGRLLKQEPSDND
jgi:protein required for attachment to host cells